MLLIIAKWILETRKVSCKAFGAFQKVLALVLGKCGLGEIAGGVEICRQSLRAGKELQARAKVN